MDIQDINLVCTCGACPEQYDALDKDGNCIAYLRLRYGSFTVECPDFGGECVYHATPNGDGVFDDDERDIYLSNAKQAIAQYYNHQSEMDNKNEILALLESAYTGAKMSDDAEMMCRLSRAIIAFSYDDLESTPTWEEMIDSYIR